MPSNALFADLYQLTMLRTYFELGMSSPVTLHLNGVCFTLGASRIPEAVASSREAVQCWLDHTSTA